MPSAPPRAEVGAGNHRERVAAALSHESTDLCPWQATFTPEFAERLRADMRLDTAGGAHNPHGAGNPCDLEIALEQDLLITSVGWANSYYGEGDRYVDEWGGGWLSVARAKSARARRRRSRSSQNRIAQTGCGLSAGFAPTMRPAFHGCLSRIAGSNAECPISVSS